MHDRAPILASISCKSQDASATMVQVSTGHSCCFTSMMVSHCNADVECAGTNATPWHPLIILDFKQSSHPPTKQTNFSKPPSRLSNLFAVFSQSFRIYSLFAISNPLNRSKNAPAIMPHWPVGLFVRRVLLGLSTADFLHVCEGMRTVPRQKETLNLPLSLYLPSIASV